MMDIQENDKFNDGLFKVIGVTKTHVTTMHTFAGSIQKTSIKNFADMIGEGTFHTHERRVIW